MSVLTIILIFAIVIGVIVFAVYKDSLNSKKDNEETTVPKDYIKKDSLLTKNELAFFNKLRILYKNKYHIQTQVSLRSVITKTKQSKYINELFKDIDFGLFDINTLEPLVLIELNDSTHKNANRYQRDLKVRKLLEESGIPLITFYSSMPNELDYLKKRVNEVIK